MKVVVTGGFGYVGGRLARLLRSRKHEVSILERRPVPEFQPFARDYRTFYADITRPITLGKAFQGADAVVHLAALNEIDCGKRPHRAIQVNVTGTLNVLDAAWNAGVRRFLYLSTFHVYRLSAGKGQRKVRITEQTLPDPHHPYGITHREAEMYCNLYREKGMETAVIRMSNSFGAPVSRAVNRWSLAVNDFCRSAMQRGTIVLKSAGRQKRDFVTLQDACRGISMLLRTPASRLGDGLFHLGSGRSYTVKDMAQKVRRVCRKDYNADVALELPADSSAGELPVDFKYSIARIGALGYRPLNNFEREIRDTLEICKGFSPERKRGRS